MFADHMLMSIVHSNVPGVQCLDGRDKRIYADKKSVCELKAKRKEYATRRE
jgi:hypothetical protein